MIEIRLFLNRRSIIRSIPTVRPWKGGQLQEAILIRGGTSLGLLLRAIYEILQGNYS